MSGYTKKAVRGAGILFSMSVLSYFLGYVLRLFIANEFGTYYYGLVYAILALFGVFSIFMELGLRSALIKYIAEFRVENKLGEIKGSIIIVLLLKLLLSGIICGVLILFSDQIAIGYFKTSEASILIKIYGVGIIFSAIIATLESSFLGFQSMKYCSSTDIVKSLIVLFITFPLLYLGFGVMAPILGFATSFILTPLIYFPLLIKRVFPEFLKVKADLSRPLVKKLFRFGVPVTLTGLAGIVFGYTDTLILTYFTTLNEVGLYNAALPTMKLITVMGGAMLSVVFPMSSELWTRNKKKQIVLGLGMIYKYAVIMVFPIVLSMFLFPDIILGILFGGEFKQAGGVLRILALGYFLNTFTGVNNSALSGIGKPGEVSRIMFSGAGVNLVLNLILIPSYGMEGAAFSTLIAFILIFVLSTWKIGRYVPFIIPWRDFCVIGLSGVLITGVAYLIAMVEFLDIWIKLAVTLITGGILYVSILFLSKTLTIQDIKEIINRVK
ncbi:MAG: flippase [Candidatus Altiarchaeota archaeon]|nr:flippase [Candidatus Altiarchaeota archaeon]